MDESMRRLIWGLIDDVGLNREEAGYLVWDETGIIAEPGHTGLAQLSPAQAECVIARLHGIRTRPLPVPAREPGDAVGPARPILDAPRLWEILASRHQGRARAITQGRLASCLCTNARHVRALTAELSDPANQGRYPVASATEPPAGLYVFTNAEERADYVAQLDARMRRLYQRRRGVVATTFAEMQRVLEF
ncbi:MAG TPA: hypothetical protein VM487_17315 [Phycisphaerae bacterium]|nr:hypothetical protein [Phycisphaerae bacterium]